MSDEVLLSQIALGRRPQASKAIGYVRDLTSEDIRAVIENAPPPAVISPLKTLRQVHHNLARLVAEGRKTVQISNMTGYTVVRIDQLRSDPTFAELVAYYTTQREVEFVDAQRALAGLGMTAVEIIQEKLDTEPEKLSMGQLLAVAELALDRSIAPNKAKPGMAGGGAGAAVPAVAINIRFGDGKQDGGGVVIEGSATRIGDGE